MSEDQGYHIFIIKSRPEVLKSAETFLRNRNWKVSSGVNMREALAYIIQQQPQIVMIAADHPNKKVAVLPKLLSQAFPVKIIAFTENIVTTSGNMLRNMNQQYNLYAPVSGPQILRIVSKIYKDEEERKSDPNYVSQSPTHHSSSIAAQEIFKMAGELNAEQLQESVDQASAAIDSLIHSDSSNKTASGNVAYIPTHGEAKQKDSQMYLAKGAEFKKPSSIVQEGVDGPSSTPQSNEPAKGHMGAAHTSQSMDKVGDHYSRNTNAKKNAKDFDPGKNRPTDSKNDLRNPSDMAPNDYYPQKSESPMANSNPTSASHPFADSTPAVDELEQSDWEGLSTNKPEEQKTKESTSSKLKKYHEQKKQAPIMESQYIPKSKKKSAIYVRGVEVEDTSSESIFIQGAKKSIDDTVIVKEALSEDKINKIENSSNMACITINSPKFSGYLVAALGKNRKIDKDFTKMIKERLFAFLKSNGEKIVDDESIDIEVKSVDFEGWAIEQAEFLRKSVHNEDEIAIAFFPTKDSNLKTEESKDEKMVKINLDEFKHDHKVEFNMYMYMPENDKYLLYTPKGNIFYATQKGRLKDKGVEHMHLKKENIMDMKRYKAQNFLNDKIDSFLNNKKSLKTSS